MITRIQVSRAFLPDWVRQECLTYRGIKSDVHQIADATPYTSRRFPPLVILTGRGNGREVFFATVADYERFLEQLQAALAADEVVLCAYALMPNHDFDCPLWPPDCPLWPPAQAEH